MTIAAVIASGGRAFVFRKDIDWTVVAWGLPGAALGALLGAILFSTAPAEWLQIFVGLFLISTLLQYRFGRKEKTFEMPKWWFLPPNSSWDSCPVWCARWGLELARQTPPEVFA